MTGIVCRTSQVKRQTFSISFLQSCHLHNSTLFTLFTHAYHTSGKCQCIDLNCIALVRYLACASKHLKERFREPKEVCRSTHHVSRGLSAQREHRTKSTLGSSGRRFGGCLSVRRSHFESEVKIFLSEEKTTLFRPDVR